MGWTDWLISIALILLVVRQVRGKKLGMVGLLWPVAAVVAAAVKFLGAVPAQLSDLLLVAVLGVVGLGLGLGCGALTRIHRDGADIIAKASASAAALWIIGMVARLAFGLVAQNGGGAAIGKLSEQLDLHSAQTWGTALITMALCEVVARTLVLAAKYHRARRGAANPPQRSAALLIDN